MGKLKNTKSLTLAEKRKIVVDNEYKTDYSWLNSAIEFNRDFRYSDRNTLVTFLDKFNSLVPLTEREIQIAENLFANLIVGNTKHKPIAVSLSRDKHKKLIPYYEADYFIIHLIKVLEKEKYIIMKIGYQRNNPNESRITRIWACYRLKNEFPLLPSNVTSEPGQLVYLKDWHGNLISYSENKKTIKYRRILKKMNQVNGQHLITLNNEVLKTVFVVIFKGSFSHHGRIYSRGYRHVQSISSKNRRDFLINGNSTVELDFSSLHIYLLYAFKGIQYEGDPYSIIDGREELRPFLKKILLSLVNGEAKGSKSYLKAANYQLRKAQKERYELIKETDGYIDAGDGRSITVDPFPINDVKPLIEKFRQKHSQISQYLGTGSIIGAKLMNTDGAIALDIINHFINKGIAILAIHDSFIVEKQYKDELYNVMKSVYHCHTGFDINVK